MRHASIIVLALGMFLLADSAASFAAGPAPQNDRSSIVIFFKDGHQKTFTMSEIERIEFKTSDASSSNVGQGRFLGEWKVGDGIGGHFRITLERGGVARKTVGAPKGTWTVVDGEARMTWDDGWRDVIRKAGNRYQKSAYAPGKTFDDDPSHTVNAESIKHEPI